MKQTLHKVAKDYISIIEKIEKTSDVKTLQTLDEQRINLHWQFMDLLKAQGIKYKDRDHATRIAIRIAKGEL